MTSNLVNFGIHEKTVGDPLMICILIEISEPLFWVVDLEVDYRGQLPVTILTVQTLIREGNRSLTLLYVLYF